MIGLILAAGKGSRLFPEGEPHISKPMIQIAGKPLITYSLDNLDALEIKKAVIVVGENRDELFSCLGSKYKNIDIIYAVQKSPRGLINAIVSARDMLNDDVILQLGDEILLGFHPETASAAALRALDFAVGYTEDSPEKIKLNFSIVSESGGRVKNCVEKPHETPNNMKGIGFCYFSAESIKLLTDVYDDEKNIPKELCDFINMLCAEGKTGYAVRFADEEINVNSPIDLTYAQKRFAIN